MIERYLHTFKGATLEDAYRRMRNELGDDAIVLRAAEVKEGGIFGMFTKTLFAVTAAAPPNSLRISKAPRGSTAVERRYADPLPKDARKSNSAAPMGIGSDTTVRDTVEYFQRIILEAKRQTDAAVSPPVAPQAVASQPVATRHVTPIVPFPKSSSAQAGDAQREFAHMRNVSATAPAAPVQQDAMPREVAPHYRMLRDTGCERTLAASIIGAAVKGPDPKLLRDPRVLHERLRVVMRGLVATRPGVTLIPGRCVVAAAVGPTGVGKTTSLAKIAAQFAVRQRASVALITADTYRIAAPEQLRVYANIIGLPMEVVNTAAEMATAVSKHRDKDLVLIDTAGSSQFNERQIAELQEMLAAAAPDEVMLMLAANTQIEDLRSSAAAFRCVGPKSIFFTKLDETKRYGVMYSVMADLKLPVSYISFGQNVPDDFTPADPGRLVDLVLEGREKHGRSSSKSA